jgi:hypothetical protein
MLPKNLMKNVFRFHIKFVVINIQIELEVTLLTIYFALQFERSEVNIRHSCLSNIRGGGGLCDIHAELADDSFRGIAPGSGETKFYLNIPV